MTNLDLLMRMLQLMHTLWIGIQFVVADAQMASKVKAMIPPHILLAKIYIC